MDIKLLAVTFFGAILANNYVLQKFKGICPFLGVSKKLDQATGMGIAVTAVMLLATAVTWPIQHFVLNTLNMGYMQNIVFILVIAALVQALELLLKKISPSLHKGLGVYLPLITTNCAVLGITIDVSVQENFLVAMVATLGCGIGFLLAMVLFSGLRSRIHEQNIPAAFRGLPVTLIAASFISLAFMGFGGVVENIFK
ncbi:MAG: RnfABCDGE type electron transport complex subunit A [Clostridia bacterium]|nr:RnfABCDGE type electron transport complex subunit A [Clostridia bacterium]